MNKYQSAYDGRKLKIVQFTIARSIFKLTYTSIKLCYLASDISFPIYSFILNQFAYKNNSRHRETFLPKTLSKVYAFDKITFAINLQLFIKYQYNNNNKK